MGWERTPDGLRAPRRGKSGELVTLEDRDIRLEEYLESAVDDAEHGEVQDLVPALIGCLRFGGRIALDKHDLDDVPSSARPFVAAGRFKRKEPGPRHVRVLPEESVDGIELSDRLVLAIRPGHGWSERCVAWFWRLAGRCYAQHDSDAFVGATVDAFRRATHWFFEEEVDLAVALDLRAAEMRALLYASHPHDDVRAVLESTLKYYDRATLPARDEYRFLVQINEVLERLRASEPFPRQLRLCLRALDLALDLEHTFQIAELHAAVGRCLVEFADAPPESGAFDLRATFTRLYGTTEPLAVAERALERAVLLERGEFYGRIDAFRRQSRVSKSRLVLARIYGLTHRPAKALSICELLRVEDPQTTAWSQEKQMVTLDEVLRAARVPADERSAFIVREVAADLARTHTVDPWSVRPLGEYLATVAQMLETNGEGHRARELEERARAIPGYDAAQAANDARRLEETQENEVFVDQLTAVFFGTSAD